MVNQRKKLVIALTVAISSQHTQAQFDAQLNLSDLDGNNGFVINGANAYDKSGRSVSDAGDINGDGIDDVIIGASHANPNSVSKTGSSYVVFGSDSGLPHPLNLSSLDGSNGFAINGVSPNDNSGRTVSAAGDINGDGIDDVIIGTGARDYAQPTSSYVVFGSDSGLPHPFELSSLNGSNGFVINGVDVNDNFGRSVSAAGDVNNDGIDDVIIGAFKADPNGNDSAGSSYLVYGSNTGLPHPLNLSSLNGNNGFVINGEAVGDFSGFSVSAAGDVNGDGIDDVIISAYRAAPNENFRSGSSYVVFGIKSGIPNPLNLSSLNGTNGFKINGVNAEDLAGFSVSAAGDMNGDGIDDLIIGAIGTNPNGNSYAGSSYVVFGSDSGFPHPMNLFIINSLNGIVINGVSEYEKSGLSVSAAGDINGDGIDDVIIGTGSEKRPIISSSYVVFGSDSGLANPLNLSLLDGNNGFVIHGISEYDYFGSSVSAAGDINGDGIDDVIIGSNGASPNGNIEAGSSYVLFGREKPIFKDGFE